MTADAATPAMAWHYFSRPRWFPVVARMAMAVLALLFALPAVAQTFPDRGRSPVVDQAGLLTPSQTLDIISKSEALFARTGRPLVVATVKSLEGRTIEDYGYRLGRHWQLGDAKKDDGVILLVAPNERKVRIETGYGARVFLTDAVSSVIIRDSILPRFKAGDYGGGIIAGTDQIIAMMELPAAEAAKRAAEIGANEQQRSRGGEGSSFPFVLVFFILFFVVIPLLRRVAGKRFHSGKRRRGGVDPWVVLWGLSELSRASRGGGSSWGGGGGSWGGGGGFSGGGGSFGGGGASGGW